METFSSLLALYTGNSPVTGELETTSPSLLRHCNVHFISRRDNWLLDEMPFSVVWSNMTCTFEFLLIRNDSIFLSDEYQFHFYQINAQPYLVCILTNAKARSLRKCDVIKEGSKTSWWTVEFKFELNSEVIVWDQVAVYLERQSHATCIAETKIALISLIQPWVAENMLLWLTNSQVVSCTKF